MGRVQNVKPISAFNDAMRILAFAENQTTGVTSMFSFVGAMPDQGLSLPLAPILGKDKNTNNVFINNGKYGATTTAEQVVEDMSFSFQLNVDFNTAVNNISPAVCKDILQAIISGEAFQYGGDDWIVVGTNGQRHIDGLTTTDIQYFFLEEGKLTDPNAWENGKRVKQENTMASAFPDTALIAFETTGKYGTSDYMGFRIPYCFETGKTFNQDTTADNYGSDMKRLGDVRTTRGSIYDVMTDPEELDIAETDELYRIEATHVIEVSGGGSPTVTGTSGDQIIVVDIDDGTVEMYKHDGTDFTTTPVTSALAQGAVIRAEKYDTSLDGATAIDKVTLTAVKTAGTTGNAVAVDVFTKTTGTGASTYALELFDFNFLDADFENAQ